MANPRFILFSPLLPKHNGIASYVAEQLPWLARHYAITVVIGNADPPPEGLPSSVDVLRFFEYMRQPSEFDAYPHVYHVGNNRDHGYMLPVLYQRPGLVVVHDLNLHHLVDTQTLGYGDADAYAWALWLQYGRAGKRLGEQFVQRGWKGEEMPKELRLNRDILRSAGRVVVHSHYSAQRILAEYPDKPVRVIPHHVSPLVDRWKTQEREQAKQVLGLPDDRPVVTSLGFITRAKQVHTALEAIAALKDEGVACFYVLAGAYRPYEYDVMVDIRRLGLEEDVRVTGFLEEEDFFRYLTASDLVLNLRYPFGGETSGTLMRALGLGRCCVVVDIGTFSEIPGDCVVRLPWGDDFVAILHQTMRDLLRDAQRRTELESRARRWAEQYNHVEYTTASYVEEIDRLVPAGSLNGLGGVPGLRGYEFPVPALVERWLQRETRSLQKIAEQVRASLWWREGLLPMPGRNVRLHLEIPEESKAGVDWVLRSLFGYRDGHLTASPGACTHRLLLASAVRFKDDPVGGLARVASEQPLGSELVMSLTDIELLPMQLRKPGTWVTVLECAGFQVLSRHEGASDISFSSWRHPQAEITLRARRVSEQMERYPASLYPDQTPWWPTVTQFLRRPVNG